MDLLVTNILGKPIGVIFGYQAVQEEGSLTLEEGKYNWYGSVGNQVLRTEDRDLGAVAP